MEKNNELISVKLYDPTEKLTTQVKVILPKNYIRSLELIAAELNIEKRYLIWDAIGNYIKICRIKAFNQEI